MFLVPFLHFRVVVYALHNLFDPWIVVTKVLGDPRIESRHVECGVKSQFEVCYGEVLSQDEWPLGELFKPLLHLTGPRREEIINEVFCCLFLLLFSAPSCSSELSLDIFHSICYFITLESINGILRVKFGELSSVSRNIWLVLLCEY